MSAAPCLDTPEAQLNKHAQISIMRRELPETITVPISPLHLCPAIVAKSFPQVAFSFTIFASKDCLAWKIRSTIRMECLSGCPKSNLSKAAALDGEVSEPAVVQLRRSDNVAQ